MSPKTVMGRVFREPLVHFMLIGALLFGAISLAKDLRRPTIRIDAQDLEQLAAYWEMQTQRPPTKAELAAIIQERVEEELLAQEAIRLGLDKDDMIIRRRLAQKVAFASEDAGVLGDPDEATLRSYYVRTADRYASPTRLALRHVFFSAERTGERADMAATAALERLRRGRPVVGDPSLLPLTYADVSTSDLRRDYGPAFLRTAEAASPGQWVGPVTTPYGVHLLRVEARYPAETPPFEVVRADVRDAWLSDQRDAAHAKYLKKLGRRYRVVVTGVPQDGS